MISIYRFDPSSGKGCFVEASTLPKEGAAAIPEKEVWWIDLDNPTEEEERAVLEQFFKIHMLSLEDISKPRREAKQGPHLPKVEEFADYLLIIVNPLRREILEKDGGDALIKRGAANCQVSAILTHRLLVTHHYEPHPSIESVKHFCERHCSVVARGPDYIFHLILDAMVDEYSPVVDRIADRLDTIESRMFRKPAEGTLAMLLRIKRKIVALRKTLILEREVLMRLTRGEFELVDEREIVYYRNVYDHLVRYTELIEGAREMVSDLLQSYLAAMSNRLNAVMKALAMISTIGLVCTLIAGIYGMNFKYMPELEWEWGYPFALGLMAIATTVAVVFFRRMKWF